jgi:hypothetical protein
MAVTGLLLIHKIFNSFITYFTYPLITENEEVSGFRERPALGHLAVIFDL